MDAAAILSLCQHPPASQAGEYLAWIPLLPLLGFLVNALCARWLDRTASALLACAAVLFSLAISAWVVWDLGGLKEFVDTCAAHGVPGTDETVPAYAHTVYQWLPFAGHAAIDLRLKVDPLSAVMILIVTGIGLLIHVYSAGYMAHDKSPGRYFAYLNLFMASMLVLVLADSLPVMFIGWEGVGLCSYLLIGFWFEDEAKAAAGKKAFIVNRIGDFGFILGIFTLFAATGHFDFDGIAAGQSFLTADFGGGLSFATVAAVLLLVGATGKSAQIPLYVWLPDAMAGPTPVSALIHAATMVTAGVYMVARMNFLYVLTPGVMLIVTVVGASTAILAAAIATAQNDIKKVLAYSTVSQLGFMFAAVGSGAFWVGIFHVMTHAFFKAGLFLGSGSVIHAMGGEQDIRKMGGLKKHMPVTRWTFFVCTLAIAGVPLLAGFFSKDEILAAVFAHRTPYGEGWLPQTLWAVLVTAAFFTAFYMMRLYLRTFEGAFRGDHHVEEHLHESPPVMTWPLVILAAGAVLVGYAGLGSVFSDTFLGTHHGVRELAGAAGEVTRWHTNALEFWLEPVFRSGMTLVKTSEHGLATEWTLVGASVAVASAGVLLAWSWYRGGREPSFTVPVLGTLAQNKFYVDELYDLLIVRPLKATADFLHVVVDEGLIDTVLVRGAAAVFEGAGWLLRRLQNGQVQFYAFVLVLGLAAMMAFFLG